MKQKLANSQAVRPLEQSLREAVGKGQQAKSDTSAPYRLWYVFTPILRRVFCSPRLHNALFVLFVGGILAYGAGLAGYLLARFDLVNLIRDVNGDDSFYYFQIAYHLAEGRFSTFDGGITRTNGYHPLWLLLITPFYWVFDKEAALFAIKTFEILLVAGGVALVAGAARLARLPWILLYAALPLLYRIPALWGGMEAAAALCLLGLFLLALLCFARHPARGKWGLAAVCFALPWVRLEYMAISLAAAGILCLIEGMWQDSISGSSGRNAIRAWQTLHAVVPLAGAVAGIAVYLTYNGLVFGGMTPVSGATKQVWSQGLWEAQGGYRLLQNVRDILQYRVFDTELWMAPELCIYVLLVGWSARRADRHRDRLLLAFLVGVWALAMGHLAKFVQTVLTVHPSLGSYSWYFVPTYLLLGLMVPVRCYVVLHFLRRVIGPRAPQTAAVLSGGVILGGILFLWTPEDFQEPFRRVEHWSAATGREWEVTSYMGTRIMNTLLPDGSVVGARDAGVIGYFARFPVVNLDGLVNSYAYLHARQEGPEAALYPSFGLTHFANVVSVIRRTPPNMLFGGPLSSRERQFRLWAVDPAGTAADPMASADRFWKSMAPHFTDQAEGSAWVVDGRLAQAFVQDCAPDDWIVWSGAPTGGRTWTRTALYRNPDGLCVTVLVLPRTGPSPAPVRAMSADAWRSRLLRDRRPVIQSAWDVYHPGDRLVYVREPCAPADVAAPFFLHVVPVNPQDLPVPRQSYGFDNLDFRFPRYGVMFPGWCLAEVPLPAYRIRSLRTGQYVRREDSFQHVWEGEFRHAP